MKLLVDIGNTNLKWGVQDRGEFRFSGQRRHLKRSPHELFSEIGVEQVQPESIWVSSVAADEVCTQLQHWCQQQWQVKPHILTSPAAGNGVVNAYSSPENLGSDRWAALVAVRTMTDRPACVIDCGSAITIDVMQANGRHLGGYIIPGLAMMLQSLGQHTASTELSAEKMQATPQALTLGNDTQSCVENGCLHAVVGFIDHSLIDVQHQIGDQAEPVTCYITGGDAKRLLPFLSAEVHYGPHLVLQGLALIAEQP